MNTPRRQPGTTRQAGGRAMWLAAVAGVCLLGGLAFGCAREQQAQAQAQTQPQGQVQAQAFASPAAAVQALTGALRSEDTKQLQAIMGPEGEPIIASGDEVADRQRRQEFLKLYDQKHALVEDGAGKATLVVGDSDWPFPVPITREAAGWVFDAAAGREEILNRRIGANELAAIKVCKAIGDAQHEYALRDPEQTGVHAYARQFASDPGRRNGLYWPTGEGEPPSPLGPLVAEAAAEGYRRKEQGPTPYHGYCYRILTAQGPHAPGGAVDYLVQGRMELGFAVVAYPAEYGNSGIMTFTMGDNGVVYQKDLGEDTAKVAGGMTGFDPGEGWVKVDSSGEVGSRTPSAPAGASDR